MGQGETTRGRILRAAADVISTSGLANTTTKQIARAAGYSEATLYKHFRDKEELCLAVMAERLKPFVELVVRLPEQAGTRTVRAHLEDLVREATAVYLVSGRLGMALFAEPTLLERQRAALRAAGGGPHKANALLAEYLRREQELGRITAGSNTAAVADLLLGACFQRAFHVSFMGPETFPDRGEEYGRELVGEVLRGLTRPGGP
jgi:AcrR family transcriptional regulator